MALVHREANSHEVSPDHGQLPVVRRLESSCGNDMREAVHHR
jgi:hypothetical protein